MHAGRLVDLVESAVASDEVIVGDAQLLAEAAVRGDGTVPVRLISPGWGSSGYYPAEVLERDGPNVFGAGLKMYWDHPTRTEESDRPERSLRDLAGELVSKARWVADHPDGAGLYSEAKVFSPFRESLDELAPHIGVSIRASGVAVHGEAEGKTGPIIEKLLSAASVDFVTEAGRGGRILELFEAARPGAGRPTKLEEARNTGEWFEARLHLMFTEIADGLFGEGRLTRDERIALSSAIGVALDSFHGAVAERANQLFSRDPYDVPEAVQPVTESRKEDHVPTPAELQESVTALQKQVDTLTESTKTIEAERDQARTEAARATEALLVVEADKVVDAELATKAKDLPEPTRARLSETLKGSAPVKDGALDRDAVVARVDEAVKTEAEYLAKVTGRGRVAGMGSGSGSAVDIPAEEADKQLEAAFAGLGLSESAAKIAAQGRG